MAPEKVFNVTSHVGDVSSDHDKESRHICQRSYDNTFYLCDTA